jgi:hypothetical protein
VARPRRRQAQPGEQPAEVGQAADQRGQAAGLQPGQERPQRLQRGSVGQVGLQRVGGGQPKDEEPTEDAWPCRDGWMMMARRVKPFRWTFLLR